MDNPTSSAETSQRSEGLSEASNAAVENEGTVVKPKGARSSIRTPDKLEESVFDVERILAKGCFCLYKNCLEDLDPDIIYRERTNLSKLNEGEHEMFLIGIVMTSLIGTQNRKIRVYMNYAYKCRSVCKVSFLYLHFSSERKLRIIQERVIANGVTPRMVTTEMISKKLFATVKGYLLEFMEQRGIPGKLCTRRPVHFPFDTTKKSLHDGFKAYCERLGPDTPTCTYGKFRNILKNYFCELVVYNNGPSMETEDRGSSDEECYDIPNSSLLYVKDIV